MIKMMETAQQLKLLLLVVMIAIFGLLNPHLANAADKPDKAARRAQLMMQKMKQDMELEKANMQAQFDTEKKALEEKLKVSDALMLDVEKQLSLSEKKNKSLAAEVTKTNTEKAVLDASLLKTKAELEATQGNLTVLKGQYSQAQADLKFNDNQRKTLSSNLAKTTQSVNECEVKNAKLHQFGTDLIQIYDKPSKYEAAMRKESFFQLKRVELENLLQDKQNSLDEAKFSSQKSAF